ncbi:MAG: radical SAM protein [Patescibacteria group bacterium]|nr:radical SAM protein [Patescibacteria group bacterium]
MEQLKYVAFHLTYVCENRCPYCYIRDEEREKHPPLEKVKGVIEKLAKSKIKEILRVGGNPCTYPYLKEVAKLIKKLNLKLFILSNTLEFGQNLVFFLDNIDDFQATVLGSTEEEHDNEAGRRGAYDVLIKNIKFLNENGKKVTIAISLHKQNYNKIFEIIKNLIENEKIKIRELVVQRVIPCGRAANTLKFSVAKEQIPIIFEQLHKIKEKYDLKIDFEDIFPLCIIPEKYRYLQTKACEWGFIKGSINFNGYMARCGADRRFLLGNIFKIKNLQEFWKKNPTLVDFRNRRWLPKECQECEFLEKCGGGCSLSRITDKDHECDILCPFC